MNVNGQQVTVATDRKDFDWFYKICKSGKAARRDDMKRVKVLDDLTKLAMSQLERQGAALEDDADYPAVADAKPAVVGDGRT